MYISTYAAKAESLASIPAIESLDVQLHLGTQLMFYCKLDKKPEFDPLEMFSILDFKTTVTKYRCSLTQRLSIEKVCSVE
jgi:hypothetical protein